VATPVEGMVDIWFSEVDGSTMFGSRAAYHMCMVVEIFVIMESGKMGFATIEVLSWDPLK
jgi:hypothetical protein